MHKIHRVTLTLCLLALASLALSVCAAYTLGGVYTLNGGSQSSTDQTYTSTTSDLSAVYVINGGSLTMLNPTVTKSGGTSDTTGSSQYGLNAGILANSAGSVNITGGTVRTDSSGSNGLFASGTSSTITMTGGSVTTLQGASHGVDVTYGGTINLANVAVTTSGDSASAALSTDYGGGIVNARNCTVTTAGTKSPAVYSTGTITVSDSTMTATGGPGGVIDGANNIYLTNCAITCKLNGFKIFRSAPGSGTATVTINGGSLTVTGGDIFYVTTSSGAATAALTLKNNAKATASTSNLVNADTGSTVTLILNHETLTGNLVADSTSTISCSLQNSTILSGSAANTALTLDSSSIWNVTSSSSLTTINDIIGISGTSITNIVGNGYTVTYNANLASNSALAGKTFLLVNGGQLAPSSTVPEFSFAPLAIIMILSVLAMGLQKSKLVEN